MLPLMFNINFFQKEKLRFRRSGSPIPYALLYGSWLQIIHGRKL